MLRHAGFCSAAGVVAGGSKGSTALFRDFLGWQSSAQKLKTAEKKAKAAKAAGEAGKPPV